MRWEGNRQSDNVEDRRGDGDGGRVGGMGGRSLGLGSIVIALLASWIFGINPMTVLGLLDGGGAAPASMSAPTGHKPPANDRMAAFVSTVLADTEDVWTAQFRQMGKSYAKPTLVLFEGRTPTACGTGQAAMGPFYCPADQQVYIDLSFYDTLQRQLGAPGDFAQAYVIAHEVGHHVQHLLGVSGKVDRMRSQVSEAQGNALSVRLELQADCLAGVWAHHAQAARQLLDAGDVEEAMNAASRIGDDALQQQAGGTVRPDSFTHGSSAQRVRWFRKGLEQGQMAGCNTFDNKAL
ncbi:MAG: metalloprotease [Ideonella sp. MAG2]|nr:MAG: metalloprotease [Ideonella sp. MAG2]